MGFDDFQDDKKNKRRQALIERSKKVASKGLKERSGREKQREEKAAKESVKKTKQEKKGRAQATELDLAGLEVTEQEAGSQELRGGTTSKETNDELDFGSLENSSPTIDISELKKDKSIRKKKKKEKKAEKTISGVFLKEPTQRQSGSFVYDAKTGQWKFQEGSTALETEEDQGSQEIKQPVSDVAEGEGEKSKFSEIGTLESDGEDQAGSPPGFSIQKEKTGVPRGGTAITGIRVEENLEYESFSKPYRKEVGEQSSTLRLNKTGTAKRENEDETFLETATVEAKLVVKAGKLKRKVFSLNEDTVYIGRSIDADITIPDARASRKHAEIRYSDGEFILEDLKSANGIKVNGAVVSKHLLQSQDKIAIGHTVLEFIIIDPAGYTEPEDSTIELDIDDERPTELATAMTGRGGAGGRNQASIQSAKTEVAEDLGFTLVDPVHGTRGGVTQEDLLPDEAFNQDSLYDSPFGGSLKEKKNIIQARSIERPVDTARLLRKFFLSVIFIILVGALGILLMYSGTGSKKEIEKGKPVATIPRSSTSGLSPETEQLAIKHYYRARDFYEAENYPSAIREAKKALGVYPDFSQAEKIIEYSRDAIKESKARAREEGERRKQEERYNFIDNQLNKADRLLMAKRYREAIVPINRVLKIDKTHQGALDLLGEAKSGIVSRTRAIQDRKRLRRTMLARYNHAGRLYSSKKYVQALAAYNRVLVMGRIISPGIYDRAKRQHALSQRRIVQKFQPRVDEIKGNMRAENYSDALKELNGILRVFPAHREATILRREAYEELTLQVKKIYQRALVVESVNDLEEANEMYQEILKLAPKGHPYYSKAVEKLKKYN